MAVDDAKSRFSNRVADYLRCRPSYPAEMVSAFFRELALVPGQCVADIGSGTGSFSGLLLDAGLTVYAVEPNGDMRAAGEARFGGNDRFHSMAGSAEATTLPDHCADAYVAAQAFHWFDVPRARAEALRILRPPARTALIWNNRREDTPFLRSYEAFLHEFSSDYAKIKHQNAEADGRIPRFFSANQVARMVFENAQVCDFEALRGRTLSASYMPAADHPRYPAMVAALRKLYDEHAEGGTVRIEYETVMYFGTLQG